MDITVTLLPDGESMVFEVLCEADMCSRQIGADAQSTAWAVFGLSKPASDGYLKREPVYLACSEACQERLHAAILAGEWPTQDPADDVTSMRFGEFWQVAGESAGMELFALATMGDARDLGQIAALMARPGITSDMTIMDAVAAGIVAESELPE
jgi:hypothetical protein